MRRGIGKGGETSKLVSKRVNKSGSVHILLFLLKVENKKRKQKDRSVKYDKRPVRVEWSR